MPRALLAVVDDGKPPELEYPVKCTKARDVWENERAVLEKASQLFVYVFHWSKMILKYLARTYLTN